LFKMLGVNFKQLKPTIEEEAIRLSNSEPSQIALRIAEKKLSNVIENHTFNEKDVVITADTVVSIGSRLLGKPKDKSQAKDFLKLLSGSWHEVITAVFIFNNNDIKSFVEKTRVKFRKLSEKVLEAYIRTNEPFDKAGGYAIQGFGGLFVEKIEGDFYNVIGLPIGKVFEIFLIKGWLNGTEFSNSPKGATVKIR